MVKENERFFDSFEYSEAEFSDYVRRFMLTGVERGVGGMLRVNTPGSMQIQVSSGSAFVEGFFFSLPSAVNIAVDPNGDDTVRRDYVTLRVQRNLNNFRIFINKGIPGPFPSVPEMERSMSYYDIVLAQIDVPLGANTITSGMVTDLRYYPEFCGFSGHGVFRAGEDLLDRDPGIAFAPDYQAGMGYDRTLDRIFFRAQTYTSFMVAWDFNYAIAPIMSAGDPLGDSVVKEQAPGNQSGGGSYNSAAQFWDRRYQLVLGRSTLTNNRPIQQAWAFRVGSSADANGAKALELFNLGSSTSFFGGDSVITRPSVSVVPFAINQYNNIFFNSPFGGVQPLSNPSAVAIYEGTINRQGLLVTSATSGGGTPNEIALVAKVGTKPGGSDASYPDKPNEMAPTGSTGLFYSNGGTNLFFIGPKGGGSNGGLIMDAAGNLGIKTVPAYALDAGVPVRFNSGVYLRGPVYGTPDANTSSIDWFPPVRFYATEGIHVQGHMDVGVTQTVGQVSFECIRNAIFYGDVNIRGTLTFGSGGGGSEVNFPFDVLVSGKFTAVGKGWFKGALQVDGDLDVYGFVRFHKGVSTNPWSFDVTGAQRVVGKFRAEGGIESVGSLYFGTLGGNVPAVITTGNQAVVGAPDGAGFLHMNSTTQCLWDSNWNSDYRGATNSSIGGLGHSGSRWTRLWSLYSENCNETGGQNLMAFAGRMQVSEDDGSVSVLPGSEVVGLRLYTPEEGLAAALATPVTTYFMSQSTAIVTEEDPFKRAYLIESSEDMTLNVMSHQLPKELSPAGGGVPTLSVALVAISAVQALERKNRDLEQRLSDLEQLIASLVPPAQA